MTTEAASTDLIISLPTVPSVATFTDEAEFDKLYDAILQKVNAHKHDVSTKKGRDEIKTLAHKIAKTKVALDKQGFALTEEWRLNKKKVDATRGKIEERLVALQTKFRQPLTDWETAEEARIAGHKARLDALIALSKTGFGRPTSELRQLLADAENTETGAQVWEEFAPQAGVAREDAIDTLKRLLATAEKQEREAAELEQLRAEKAERDRVEAERLAAEEAVNQKRRYARSLIEHIKQCALGMIDGKTYPYPILFRELEEKITIDDACGDMGGDVETARREAIARLKEGWIADQERAARQAEQEKARAGEEARIQADREAQEKIEAAKRAAVEAEERHAKAVREAEEARLREAEDAKRREQEAEERLNREIAEARAQAARDAQAIRQRIIDEREAEVAEQKRRDADKEHRKAINQSIVAELVKCAGIAAEQAQKIVVHMVSGLVPNVTLKY